MYLGFNNKLNKERFMANGYTVGIIDGTIKTFNDYAKLCMKAFGATIQEYRKAEPSKYHIEKLEELREQKRKLSETNDKALLDGVKKELEADYEDNLKKIEEIKDAKTRLKDFLQKAKDYEAPTRDHEGIKSFMIEQLKITLDYDGDYSFYEDSNLKIKAKLNNLNATVVRLEKLNDIEENIAYHLKSYNKEVERCERANLWVTNFLHSLEE